MGMFDTKTGEAERFESRVIDARVKGLVLICVVVVHGVALVAVFELHVPLRENAAQFVSTIFFVEERKRKEPAKARREPRRSVEERPHSTTTTDLDKADSFSLPPLGTDWNAEREKIAGDIVGREAARANERSLLSRPKVIELPPPGSRHKPGDSQHFDDGEIITWLDEDCYATNRPHDGPQLDPNRLHVVCKNPDRPTRTDLFDYMKPGYLRDSNAPPPKFDGIFRADAKCEYSAVRCN